MKLSKKRYYLAAFIIFFMTVCGCALKLSEKSARALLEPILQEDLTVITDGLDSSGLLENPYFEIKELSKFEEGQYQYLAVADFYFLKTVQQKIVRKYRFNKIYSRWELYYNEYQSY